MIERVNPLYCPALRLKAGELDGVRQLATDVADAILPRFIVPPSSERDEKAPLLLDMQRMPDVSSMLAGVWRRRAALIDVTYIIDEFGRDNATDWLPGMFERARTKDVRAIPAARLSDIGDCSEAFRAAIDGDDATKFAIIVQSDEMVGTEIATIMAEALNLLRLKPADCVVIADFSGAEFSQPEIVAPIIGGALEALQELGVWQQIVFQGSHYPDKNPAPKDGGVEFWPRNEWRAWCLAVRFDPSTAQHMIFGDYAADCSRIQFGNGGKAIRHVRYTSGQNWRVQRGAKTGKDRDSMHRVYEAIAASTDFAGAGFSVADAYIARAAADPAAPHGNAKIWRQLNTTHHITQVVSDIAKVRGTEIKTAPVAESVQGHLLPET